MKGASQQLGIAAFVCLLVPLAHGAEASPIAAKVMPLAQARAQWARPENDAGPLEGRTALTHLTLLLARPADRQAAFEDYLRLQQDPSSPAFHQWLGADQIGQRFGPPAEQVATVTSWLRSQGLSVDAISPSGTRVEFSGSATAIGAAFGSPLHAYIVNGQKRISIADAPRVPVAIAGFVQSVHGLESVFETPHLKMGERGFVPKASETPEYTLCGTNPCTHFITPDDFTAIYDVRPLYQQGLTGAGQTVAIIGRARVNIPDIELFQQRTNLAVKDPVITIPPRGIDPGPPQTDPPADSTDVSRDQSEATLDVTRVAGTAPGANINLVIAGNSTTVSGINVASQYVINAVPTFAQVMTISFGACESAAGSAYIQLWNALFAEATAEGISVFVSSGDQGAAECDTAFKPPPATQSLSPNAICASGYATCVGGTQFADTSAPSLYWSTANGAGRGSALGYIPEGAWNEPLDANGDLQIAATGGGVSAFMATPSWQTGPGVPGTQGRYTPDISFTSSRHNAYFSCFAAGSGSCVTEANGGFHFATSYGTSAAAPSMAALTALLDQKMGGAQGNLNPQLYQLARTGGNGAFHDVTVATSGVDSCDISTPSLCNNSLPGPDTIDTGIGGYLVGPGYDLATGLGSIDAAKLFAQWTSTSTGGTTANYQGLWWNSPANSESGWGINLAHQGDTIFATWFTYDLTGVDNWLVMTAQKSSTGSYTGALYGTTGPAFSSVPFNPQQVTATQLGNGTLTFSGANDGTFSYTIGNVSQTKQITREVFGTLPTCATAASVASLAAATNYTDLWWASPANSESGWGINLNHEGTTIFATWFTYGSGGKAMWLVITALPSGTNAFTGTVYRTSGPPFNSVPFNPANVAATAVGNASFIFADGNNATFSYTVDGVTQTKHIIRELFSPTGTVCH